MTISLRTRLFASAALIVAVVLATVLALGWRSLLRNEIDRLGDRLCQEARRVATLRPDPEALARLEQDLRGRMRLGGSGSLLLQLAIDDGGRPLRSPDWPPDLDLAALPWREAQRFGPPPREFGPGEQGTERRGPEGRGPEDRRPPPGAPPQPPRGICEQAAARLGGSEWRSARFVTPLSSGTVLVDLAPMKADMQSDLRRALQVVVPLALVLTGGGAWLLASLTMRPVNRLRKAMLGVNRRGAGDSLGERLGHAGEDREFRELIAAYNTMLDRLQASFQQASRFSADAAHELRTPLTILRGRVERAIQASEGRALQADLVEMQEELARLEAITRKLLLLSQADAGHLALRLEDVDLAERLHTLVADAQMLLGDAQAAALQADIAPGLHTRADALLLGQLCNNLLSNALRYRGGRGWIHIEARAVAGGVEVVFANACAPVAAEQRQRFFSRFHRGDSAHNRAVDGHGLGLSIAREIARAHGGDLVLLASDDDQVRLRLWLPAG